MREEKNEERFFSRALASLRFHNVLSVIRERARNWGVYIPRLRSFVILYFLCLASSISVKVTLVKHRRETAKSRIMSTCFFAKLSRDHRNRDIVTSNSNTQYFYYAIYILDLKLIDTSVNIESIFSSEKYLKRLIKTIMDRNSKRYLV